MNTQISTADIACMLSVVCGCSGLWDKYTLSSESSPLSSHRYVAAVFKDSEWQLQVKVIL